MENKCQLMFNCSPEDLHREAKKADRSGTIDGLVVSAVSTLIGTDNPKEGDLEKSGICVPLREFREKLDSDSIRRKCGDLPEVSVYKVEETEYEPKEAEP